VDAETKAAITRLELAIDSLAGMVAGCAAYLTALDESRHVDKRKALGVSRRFVPDGLSGNTMHSPAVVAQAMIEQMGDLSRQLAAVKARAQDQESQGRRPLARDWQGRPRELNPMLDKRR
jgi:hypothetical protein